MTSPIQQATNMADTKTTLNEAMLRQHGQAQAKDGMDAEQKERSVAEWKKSELHPSLERSMSQKKADAMTAAEHKDQMANPRQPSKQVADNLVGVIESIASQGGRRRASIEANHEQMARIQQHLMETQVGEGIRRTVAASAADAAADLEQHQRATQHFVEQEVNMELRRTVAAKEASKAAGAEHMDQVANPRQPSKQVADGISMIVQSIASQGGRRRASIEANHEQMARIQQHLMETQVGEGIRRTVAASAADAAADLEQHQRATQHFIEQEVNMELRRTVAAKEASKAAGAEHMDQVANPRRPSKEVADNLVGVIESIARRGSSRRASVEANHEQMARIQQHLMETQVGEGIRRTVAAGEADSAADAEQQRRSTQHYMETEVNTELRRTVAGSWAAKAVEAERQIQSADPRRPSAEIADGIAQVVQAIAPIGNRRRASIEMAAEQTARIQQHVMETEVGTELRRKVAASEADSAMVLEQAQRISQRHMESEVNTELRRTVAAKEADAMADVELKEQIASPRRPSKEIMAAKTAINYAIDGAVVVGSTSG